MAPEKSIPARPRKKPSELRKKAEAKLKSQVAPSKVMSAKETQQLIHELQMHQIELEMQNEELRKSQAELEESRSKYSDLYDFAPVGYFTFDRQGLVLEANLIAAEELGTERSLLINKPFRTYIIVKDREIFDQHLREIFTRDGRKTCEIRLKKKDGSMFYAQLESIAANDLRGNSLCRTSVIDITAQKRAEETLQKNEKLYRLLAENTNDVITRHLPDSTYLYVSPACRTLFGYEPEELIGTKAFAQIHPEDVKGVIAITQEAIRTGGTNLGQYRHLKKDGQYVWVETVGKVIKNEETGTVEDIFCVVRDITERKRAEEELSQSREREHFLADIIEKSDQPVAVGEPDGRLGTFNRAFCELTGYSAEELSHLTWNSLTPPEWVETTMKALAELDRTGRPVRYEKEYIRKGGGRMPVEILLHAVWDEAGKVHQYYAFVTDITERKRAADNLRQLSDRLLLATRAAKVGIWDWDILKNELVWDDAMHRLYGVPPDRFKGYETWQESVHPEDRARTLEEVEMALRGEKEFDTEFRVVRPDQSVHHLKATGLVQRDASGRAVRMLGTNWDITERRRAELEREISVEFLQIVNGSTGYEDLLKESATFFQKQSGCEAVGIRMKKGDDYPYYEAHGFPQEFVKAENSLCSRDEAGEVIRDEWSNPVLACMCGNVIRGRFDPSKPFFSNCGSFWSNNTTDLLASTTEADRQARTRNRCNGEGYESVALIALHVGQERLGLIQLNDRRKGMFSPEIIAFWERLAGYLAVALAKSRAEEALRESEAHYHTLFENMLNGFAYCRMLYEVGTPRDFVYLAVNPAFEKLTGLKDVAGKKVSEVIPGIREADAGLIEIYARVAATGISERFEYYVEALRMWFSISVYSPQKEYFVAVFDVITERKEAEEALRESEERFRMLVESAPEAIFVQSQGCFRYLNPAMIKLLGALTPEELIGKEFMEWIAPEYREAVRGRIRMQRETGNRAQLMEQEFLRLDGSRVAVETTAVAVNFQGRDAHLVFVRDITDRKRAEEDQKRNELRMIVLLELNRMIESSLQDITRFALEEAIGLTQSTIGYLAFLNEDETILTMYSWSKTAMEECQIQDKPIIYPVETTGLWGEAVRKRRAIITNDYAAPSPWKKGCPQGHVHITRHMNVPVFEGERIVLVAGVGNKTERYNESDVNQLTLLMEGMWRIVQRQRAEEEARKLTAAVEHAADWILITDREGTIEYVNRAVEDISGYAKEELIGKKPGIFRSGRHDESFYRKLWGALRSGEIYSGILINRKKSGEIFELHYTITPLRDGRGNIVHFVATAKDITLQKFLEERLDYTAYYDDLTGLPNRSLFADRLHQAIKTAEHQGRQVAVVAVDVDRFTMLNDTLGYEAGDELLKRVGKRLSQAMSGECTVARLDADKFGIVCVEMAHSEDVVMAVEKIRNLFRRPFKLKQEEVVVTLSMGISMFPDDAKRPESLMKNTDIALSKAKAGGMNAYQFFTAEMNARTSEFIRMQRQLSNALQRNEFVMYYQPYFDISTQDLVGMEALLRWKSPDFGLVSPGMFIPILEETGLMIEVGGWIVKSVCGQIKEWMDKGYKSRIVPVHTNLSLTQLRQKDLADRIEYTIGETGIYPSFFGIEITESTFMEHFEQVQEFVTRLKKLGVSVSIDDFGTGYSSLSALKRMPVDNLKIDLSFIRDLADNPDDASIVITIISMAHNLNLKTIAEGVETREQRNILHILKCDMAQGYYFSRPLPAPDMEKYLTPQ